MILSDSQQRTIRRPVECTGIGLHGGRPVRVRLCPAGADEGITFRRTDLRGSSGDVRASIDGVSSVDHATTVSHPSRDELAVQTVEHLLAALHGMGVDACRVDLDGPELPILDGSAAPWVYLLREAGIRRLSAPRRVRRIVRPLTVASGDASVSVYPSDRFRVTCRVSFAHPAIGEQECSLTITPRTFAEELAPARTFGFLREVEALRRAGLVKGGSYSNAIVLDEHGVLNGLRFRDEFVRHKALDLIGDLALTGLPLLGHVVAQRAGHRLHAEFGRSLLATRSAWKVETAGPERRGGLAAGALGAPVFGLPAARPVLHD